jgi:hypothetical protein
MGQVGDRKRGGSGAPCIVMLARGRLRIILASLNLSEAKAAAARFRPAFHKRCSTIERNTTTIIATIKSVTCPLALCKNPRRRLPCIVMLFDHMPAMSLASWGISLPFAMVRHLLIPN